MSSTQQQLPPDTQCFWKPHPGPQTEALKRTEKEILYGGSRGGGKSECGRVFMLNPAIEENAKGEPLFPAYRGLVLRLHAEDLTDWVDKADTMYRPFGAKKVGRPAVFHFPGGQKILTNHLQNRDAFQKYQGQEFQRMLLEEATQIPEEDRYNRLLASCRSTIPGLTPRVFLTANPGGAGHGWVQTRFVKVFGKFNKKLNRWEAEWDLKAARWKSDGETTRIPEGMPFFVLPPVQTVQGTWRIFIPARVDDNPTLIENDPGYLAMLESLPEALRRAWRHGDWDSFSGQYFEEFRPYGPIGGDNNDNARHVIPCQSMLSRLEPWWFRRIAMDWGFEHPSAVLWGCQNPTGRLHVYRELVINKLGSVELGARIGELTLDDLSGLPDPTICLSIDPMAWGKKDEHQTIAENIASGIDKALGRGTARLVQLDGTVVNSLHEKVNIQTDVISRGLKPQPTIVIQPAENSRVAGWMHVHEQLRWTSLFPGASPLDEVLPKLWIHDCCPKLIDSLSVLVHDETNPEDAMKMPGDDPADALRYLLVAHNGQSSREPLLESMNRKLAALRERYPGGVDPTIAFMVAQKAEADYRKSQGSEGAVTSMTRLSSRRGKYGRLADIGRTLGGGWKN